MGDRLVVHKFSRIYPHAPVLLFPRMAPTQQHPAWFEYFFVIADYTILKCNGKARNMARIMPFYQVEKAQKSVAAFAYLRVSEPKYCAL